MIKPWIEPSKRVSNQPMDSDTAKHQTLDKIRPSQPAGRIQNTGNPESRKAWESRHLVHAEQRLVLGHQGIVGLRQDLHQHGLSQAVEGHHHGQAAAELGDQAKLDEVPRLHQAQQGVFLFVVRGRVAAVGLVALVCFRGSSSALAAQCGGSKTQVLWTQQSVIMYGQLHSMGLPNPGTVDTAVSHSVWTTS